MTKSNNSGEVFIPPIWVSYILKYVDNSFRKGTRKVQEQEQEDITDTSLLLYFSEVKIFSFEAPKNYGMYYKARKIFTLGFYHR